jgi:hypothetical protein
MDKELSILLIIAGLLALCIVLKPVVVRAYCQYRFTNFQQRKIALYKSLPADENPSTWQRETAYELVYQVVYADCLRELGETP